MFKILWIGFVAYNFTDKKTGKPVSGSTLKAVVSELSPAGAVVGLNIVKVGALDGGEYPVQRDVAYSQLYYDRFGRVIAAQPASKR